MRLLVCQLFGDEALLEMIENLEAKISLLSLQILFSATQYSVPRALSHSFIIGNHGPSSLLLYMNSDLLLSFTFKQTSMNIGTNECLVICSHESSKSEDPGLELPPILPTVRYVLRGLGKLAPTILGLRTMPSHQHQSSSAWRRFHSL